MTFYQLGPDIDEILKKLNGENKDDFKGAPPGFNAKIMWSILTLIAIIIGLIIWFYCDEQIY